MAKADEDALNLSYDRDLAVRAPGGIIDSEAVDTPRRLRVGLAGVSFSGRVFLASGDVGRDGRPDLLGLGVEWGVSSFMTSDGSTDEGDSENVTITFPRNVLLSESSLLSRSTRSRLLRESCQVHSLASTRLLSRRKPGAGILISGKGEVLFRYASTARIDLGKAELIIEFTATGIDPM